MSSSLIRLVQRFEPVPRTRRIRDELHHGRSTLQAVLVLSLGLLVFGVLVAREIATAERIRREDPSIEDFRSSPLPSRVRRDELLRLLGNFTCFGPETTPSAGQPAEIRQALPVGAVYDVVIHGGMAGPLAARSGAEPETYVAYAFVAHFRRTIESNDGHRVVELREYDTVRTVKILTPVSGLELRPEANGLLDLPPVEAPYREGIVSMDLQVAARAILASPCEKLMSCESSRAFSEVDPLSHRSLRITHEDGVGVVGVEALGWSMTIPDASHIFRTVILLPTAGDPPQESSAAVTSMPTDRLVGLIHPSMELPGDETVDVSCESSGTAGHGARILQISHYPSGGTPGVIGTIRTDETGLKVAQADLEWPFYLLLAARERLLFEVDFPQDQTIRIHYACVPAAGRPVLFAAAAANRRQGNSDDSGDASGRGNGLLCQTFAEMLAESIGGPLDLVQRIVR